MADGHRVAVVTGASSGIGAATVRALRGAGFDVIAGARRVDRLREVTESCAATAAALDVRDRASVEAFAASVPRCDVLVNNAGGALGLAPLAQADDEHWRAMWETNVFGLMLMTRALLPKLEASGNGYIVNIGSIAGIETYPNGSGYTSVKHAVRTHFAHAAHRAAREADPCDGDRPGAGRDGVQRRAVRGRPRTRGAGVRRHDAARRGRYRPVRRVVRDAAEARQHRRARGAATGAGHGDAGGARRRAVRPARSAGVS